MSVVCYESDVFPGLPSEALSGAPLEIRCEDSVCEARTSPSFDVC